MQSTVYKLLCKDLILATKGSSLHFLTEQSRKTRRRTYQTSATVDHKRLSVHGLRKKRKKRIKRTKANKRESSCTSNANTERENTEKYNTYLKQNKRESTCIPMRKTEKKTRGTTTKRERRRLRQLDFSSGVSLMKLRDRSTRIKIRKTRPRSKNPDQEDPESNARGKPPKTTESYRSDAV